MPNDTTTAVQTAAGCTFYSRVRESRVLVHYWQVHELYLSASEEQGLSMTDVFNSLKGQGVSYGDVT